MGWRWGTPRKDMGPMEVLWDGDGLHSPHVDRQINACENITSHRATYVGGKCVIFTVSILERLVIFMGLNS